MDEEMGGGLEERLYLVQGPTNLPTGIQLGWPQLPKLIGAPLQQVEMLLCTETGVMVLSSWLLNSSLQEILSGNVLIWELAVSTPDTGKVQSFLVKV